MCIRDSRCSDSYLQSVAGALLVAMLYFHFQALTLNAVQDVMLWALMGLIVAVAIIAEKQQSQPVSYTHLWGHWWGLPVGIQCGASCVWPM